MQNPLPLRACDSDLLPPLLLLERFCREGRVFALRIHRGRVRDCEPVLGVGDGRAREARQGGEAEEEPERRRRWQQTRRGGTRGGERRGRRERRSAQIQRPEPAPSSPLLAVPDPDRRPEVVWRRRQEAHRRLQGAVALATIIFFFSFFFSFSFLGRGEGVRPGGRDWGEQADRCRPTPRLRGGEWWRWEEGRGKREKGGGGRGVKRFKKKAAKARPPRIGPQSRSTTFPFFSLSLPAPLSLSLSPGALLPRPALLARSASSHRFIMCWSLPASATFGMIAAATAFWRWRAGDIQRQNLLLRVLCGDGGTPVRELSGDE